MKNLFFLFISIILLGSCSPKTTWVNRKDINLNEIQGKWKLKDKEAYEKWAKSSEQEYSGVAYNMDAGYPTITEQMRIFKKDKNWYYEAKTAENGNVPVLFQWIPDPLWNLKFVNEKHDFPQNICYKINADNTLFVQISNLAESKKSDFYYIKVLPQ